MELEPELRRQIAVSLLAGVVFVAGLVYIGTTYGSSETFTEEGAIVLVGLLAGFVLFMAAIGAFLIRANRSDESTDSK